MEYEELKKLMADYMRIASQNARDISLPFGLYLEIPGAELHEMYVLAAQKLEEKMGKIAAQISDGLGYPAQVSFMSGGIRDKLPPQSLANELADSEEITTPSVMRWAAQHFVDDRIYRVLPSDILPICQIIGRDLEKLIPANVPSKR